MRRSLIAIATAVMVAGCSGATATMVPSTAPPQTATPGPGTSPSPTPVTDGITGFGATIAAWDATHAADTRFAAETAYDPTPGLGPDQEHNAKYFGVVAGDRVLSYSERLPHRSRFADAKAAALAELPPDAKVVWTRTRTGCAQMELRSATLGQAIGARGRVYVKVVTETRTGGSRYNPKNADELIFLLADYPKKKDAPAC